MTQYFADVLQKPTSSLDVPDLQAIAKDHNLAATLTLCRLTIVIGVQCEQNKQFIDKIQGLSETDQHHLMKAIEQVMAKIAISPAAQDLIEANMTEYVSCSSGYHLSSYDAHLRLETTTITAFSQNVVKSSPRKSHWRNFIRLYWRSTGRCSRRTTM
ncbi:hypothetical protein CPC08DRAFT_38418 [Agrocybe pediades]|nr:hypothetical protein CPC08DRAFT_38418 [Agrocybe pediades]